MQVYVVVDHLHRPAAVFSTLEIAERYATDNEMVVLREPFLVDEESGDA